MHVSTSGVVAQNSGSLSPSLMPPTNGAPVGVGTSKPTIAPERSCEPGGSDGSGEAGSNCGWLRPIAGSAPGLGRGAVALGVVGNESTGVIVVVGAVVGQLASSWLVFPATSLSSSPVLSLA